MSTPIHDPLSKKLDEESRIEVKNTTCYMCACRCGIRVTLRDGEIRFIEGNPDHPINKGRLCARGQTGIGRTYHPDRIEGPASRSTDGSLQSISW